MTIPLHVLILEDRMADAELMVHELHRAGFDPQWQLAENRDDYLALLSEDLDFILADYTLPQFDAPRALQVLQERELDIPLIVVTGSISEEAAVQCMKWGAADYLLKDRLMRLGPAVKQALEAKRARDEQKQAEQALQESEERFRSIVEQLTDGFALTDQRGVIVEWNEALEQISGIAAELALGQTLSDVMLQMTAKERRTTENLDHLQNAIRNTKEEIVNASHRRVIERDIVRPDGTHRSVQLTIFPIQTQEEQMLLGSIVRDVTTRKRDAEELRRLKEFNEGIVQNMAEGIVVEDAEGHITFINPAAEKLLEYAKDELEGQHWTTIIPPDQRSIIRAANERRRVGKSDVYEIKLVSKGGQRIPVLISGTPQIQEEHFAGTIAVFTDITERKRTEEAMQQYIERLRIQRAIDGAVLAAWSPEEVAQAALRHIRRLIPCIGASVMILDREAETVSPLAMQIDVDLGLEEKQGLSVKDIPEIQKLQKGEVLVKGDISDYVTPPPLIQMMQAANLHSYLAVPLVTPGGSLNGILGLSAQVEDAFSNAHIDIACEIADQISVALHQAHLRLALESERRRLETLVEHLPQGVLLLDAEQRILLSNPVAKSHIAVLTGRPPSLGETLLQLAGRPLEELLRTPTPGRWHELEIGTLPQQVFEVIAQPVIEKDILEGWLLLLWDVTQEKAAQEYSQRQDRLAAVGQMAGGIAHDFNNLLTTIMLYAQMSRDQRDLPATLDHYLQIIISESQQAADLVQQILDFSRRSPIETHPVDIKPFIKESVKILQRTIPEHISLILEITPEAQEKPLIVKADPTRIQQVLLNLVVNARDAMPKGGKLTIALSTLVIALGETPPDREMEPGDWICLSVSDNGVGISPDVRPHIFDPFFSTKPRDKGTGLGLSQVYGIVTQHAGAITLDTEVGKGTTFRVYLPAYQPNEAAFAPDESAVSSPPSGQGETILLVEDNTRIRRASQELLESLGYQVVLASNGRIALELYQSAEHIDLILTDAIMPEMGGVELIRHLGETAPEQKVIVMTGHLLSEDLEEIKSQGIQEIIHKPLDLNVLADVIRRVLDAD